MAKGFNTILKGFLDIVVLVVNYIYDFIFDWEDEPYEKKFIENEKLKHSIKLNNTAITSLTEKNSTVSIINDANKKDFDNLKSAFGMQTADYIVNLRQEVDHLVKEHGLVQEDSMMVVISPENFRNSLLSPDFFETTLERIYSQCNKDVILKLGNIMILKTAVGVPYAEVQIETYSVSKEILASI